MFKGIDKHGKPCFNEYIKLNGGKGMKTKTRQTPEQLTCAYCGAIKQEISFFIGATKKADWCMVEGTGKMTCPNCYDKAMAEGKEALDKHIQWVNNGCK